MKNETARREIESLDYYLQNHTDDYSEESHTAMMMAVKALEQAPCRYWQNGKCNGNTEVCEDAISRQAVLDAIMANCIWENEYNLTSSSIKKAVESLPPVNPQEPFKPMVEIDLYSVIKQKYIERDVLDKIRADIEDLRFGQPLRKLVVDECLEIIDKYKAEARDKE